MYTLVKCTTDIVGQECTRCHYFYINNPYCFQQVFIKKTALHTPPPDKTITNPVPYKRIIFHKNTELVFPNGHRWQLVKDAIYVGIFDRREPKDPAEHQLAYRVSHGQHRGWTSIRLQGRLDPPVPYTFYDTKVTVKYKHLFDTE